MKTSGQARLSDFQRTNVRKSNTTPEGSDPGGFPEIGIEAVGCRREPERGLWLVGEVADPFLDFLKRGDTLRATCRDHLNRPSIHGELSLRNQTKPKAQRCPSWRGYSVQVRPSNSRPFAFLLRLTLSIPQVPHCLKKKALQKFSHCSLIESTHS